MRDIEIVSLGKRTFRVGEADRRKQMIAINKRLRGEHIPHVCTCAQNHGWH